MLARHHYRETLWLRDTLESVARELERMASRGRETRQCCSAVPDGCGSGYTRACGRGGLPGETLHMKTCPRRLEAPWWSESFSRAGTAHAILLGNEIR